MRNTTKLKAILLTYTVSFDLDENDIFIITLMSKANGKGKEFQAKTYSLVISKAYYYMMGELARTEGRRKKTKEGKSPRQNTSWPVS
jgi:hypothetical protein